MSTNEDEASETSRPHDESIELLDRKDPQVKYLTVDFYYMDVDPSDTVEITWRDEQRSEIAGFSYTLSDPAEWERLGSAIGRCSTIQEVDIRKVEGEIDQIDDLNQEVRQCIDSLYRGLESNTSIESFELDMDLFPSSGVFPTLDLNGALFKENLKLLSVSSEIPIGINQTHMVLPLLESTSLENFSISQCNFANEAAVYTGFISECTRVQRLQFKFIDTSEFATSVATLLWDQRSILTQLSLYLNESADNLPIVIDGLTGNTTLRTLRLPSNGLERVRNQFERLLCNTSSIDGIHNSNHTLELVKISGLNSDNMSVQRKCLELNKDTNKDKVIRTKIARYYFRGEFDVSPFVDMNVKLLPQVMAMIEGDPINQRDAIYRLLKSIPDLCTLYRDGLKRKKSVQKVILEQVQHLEDEAANVVIDCEAPEELRSMHSDYLRSLNPRRYQD